MLHVVLFLLSTLVLSQDPVCKLKTTNFCYPRHNNCTSCVTEGVQDCGFCFDRHQCQPGTDVGPSSADCGCQVWVFGKDNFTVNGRCRQALCASYNCSDCTAKSYCVWCEQEQMCISGGILGPFDPVHSRPVICRDWRWWHCGGMIGFHIMTIVGSVMGGIFAFAILVRLLWGKFHGKCTKSDEHLSLLKGGIQRV